MKKRTLALLLSCVMCFGLLSTGYARDWVSDGSDTWVPDAPPAVSDTPDPGPGPGPGPIGPGGSTDSAKYTHNISIPAVTGGAVTAKPFKDVYVGELVTLNVTANSGYEVESVTVVNSNGTEIPITAQGSGVYTFLMPDTDVSVRVTFRSTAPAKPAAPVFTDVAVGAYYYDAVLWAVENKITTGATATTFAPNDSCTRAQAVTFLWRAAGEPEPTSSVNPFTDVDVTAYYGKAVLWAVEKGITTGTTDTTFSPNGVVSRGQMVTFMWRAAGKPAAAAAAAFPDVESGAYYADAVSWAAGKIVNGMPDGTFAPNSNCTRGQIVTMLFRAQ